MSPKTFAEAQGVLAASLPNYTRRPHQETLAAAIEEAISAERPALAQGGCGCIQGDAEIIVNRGGNSRHMRLSDVVTRFHGGRTEKVDSLGRRSVQSITWDTSIPTFVQREDGGVTRLARLINAWESGIKQTFTVTTETGRSIRATDEHPFLTDQGWLRLDELELGDLVHVRGAQQMGGPRKISYKRISRMQRHPYANHYLNGSAIVPEHRLVVEADLNGLDYNDFLRRVITGQVDGLQFLDPDVIEIHHKDHNPLNNELSNLVPLTGEEHAIYHADVSGTNNILFKIALEEVISITPYGHENTYDLEVADDPHNFIANGFVVHNTGKSMAGLIPAILSGKRTVVATATKTLQEQLKEKDLPFLEEHFGPFEWAILKGRSNYPCHARIRELSVPTIAQAAVIAALDDVEPGAIPDRESLSTTSDAEWMKLSISAAECPGKKACPFGEQCFPEKAKARAADAQIVVTNTAYLMTDLIIKRASDGNVSLLGDYEQLIIDEAHTLPDIATSALSDSIGENALTRLASDAEGYLRDQRASWRGTDEVRAMAMALWIQLDELFTARNETAIRNRRAPEPARLSSRDLLGLGESVLALAEAITMVMGEIARTRPEEKTARLAKARLERRCGDWHARLSAVLGDSSYVRWLEQDEVTIRGMKETRLYLRSAPLSPARFLREMIWDVTPAVLMSATLTTGRGDFSFLRDQVGLAPGEAIEHDAGTPFDFATQALTYVPPKDAPLPSGATAGAWRTVAQEVTRRLVEAAGGNALLLYTSRSAMTDAHTRLAPVFRDAGITVLRQGDAPPAELTRQLKAGGAVLFGLKSFFAGVDVAGAALRLVVIDKLPFAVPTDVLVAARSEAAEARWGKGASFGKLTVPSMSLELIQGCGRLIRHRDDHGVMAILDPRLMAKGYGKRILGSLPPAPVTTDLAVAEKFLADHQ